MMSDLLAAVSEVVPWMRGRAAALDRDATFPAEEIERLRRAGALSPPLPVCFCSSWMIWDLSDLVRVGALRIRASFGSLLKTFERASMAFEVGSRLELFTAAVYYSLGEVSGGKFGKLLDSV